MSSLFEVNDVTISGNLTRDPKLRQLDSGMTLCSIRIAHNERRRAAGGEWIDNPQYFNVTIWTSLTEWTARHVHKGDKVVINGRLHWSEYETTDGQVRQVVDINANSLIHIPRRHPVERAADAADAAEEHTAHIDAQHDDIPF
jgi:single-strand DNA-binding protein